MADTLIPELGTCLEGESPDAQTSASTPTMRPTLASIGEARLADAAISVPPRERIGWLAKEAGITRVESLSVWGQFFAMSTMNRSELDFLRPLFDLVAVVQCQRSGAFLASKPGDPTSNALFLVLHDPTDLANQQRIESVIDRQSPRVLVRVLVDYDDFEQRLAVSSEAVRAMDSIEIQGGQTDQQNSANVLQLSISTIEATSNPTVRLVDSTLYDALRVGASDIHFELQSRELCIKYRLDGVLQLIRKVANLETAHQVVSRIKVLSDLDISERRIPQDGRFRAVLDQREVDFRVSIMPNIAGEDAVLRILDRKHLTGQFQALTLDSLSFDDEVKAFVRRASHLPYGLLLVTGPTGSGKTTTLYAAISEVNTGLDKIITIEDPIEYQLSGVLQIPVNEKKGLTFAKGLRSVLRHDPDKIMVGEIRDAETAQIAVQAALTGHQVFTTVHANNVFDVIGRFTNMGVDSFSLVAALTGIMAQRLVRKACVHCATSSVELDDEARQVLEVIGVAGKGASLLKKATGCDHCHHSGYKGRAAIAETMTIDDEMKDLLVQKAPISKLKGAAVEKGFRGLRQSAIALALRGVTTMDEVNRVAPRI